MKEEEEGESGKHEFTKKKEGADCDNGGDGVLARLLDFVRHRWIQQPAIARFCSRWSQFYQL